MFYTQAYAKLNQKFLVSPHRVRAAISYWGDEVMFYPFVQRRLVDLPGLDWVDPKLGDIRGLYGRSGPVGSLSNVSMIREFSSSLNSYFEEEGIISSFDRSHPLIHSESNFPEPFVRQTTGFEVVVDLEQDLESLKRSFRPSVRKSCRKAVDAGVRCAQESGEVAWSEFVYLYQRAMDRKVAGSFYHFGADYFDGIKELMFDNHSLYIARIEEKVVSAEVVLHGGRFAHSFLGATDTEFHYAQPNSMLKFRIIEDLKSRNYSKYILGGGLSAGDGIFTYKKTFAPMGVVPSSILTSIHDKAAYERLRSDLVRKNKRFVSDRFQFYDQS